MGKAVARNLDEWDAEIEAEFQRCVAATKAGGQRKRGRKLVAFPWAFLVDVCQRTRGRTTLVVAEYIYRRTHVCRSQTVTLPASELKELGVSRQRRQEALVSLHDAGFIKLEKAAGCSTKVTLTWKPR